ncbi:TPA: hypothetical protein N0F65_009126 [Lagenidium giganteum]|uniref:Tetraspanin n=1 Tax=Lagenidium giganteum TaxID=4803 RepID=A0AAV2YMJ3_9STRA|nr:TPA: hypothetical protein N0F65_009126 [Lagenidium giganteum]
MIFSKESLIQSMSGASCFSVLQMLLLVILGAVLMTNQHYHQLLGNDIKRSGGGLVFTGVMYLLTTGLGICSARTLNKFLMLLQFIVLATLIFFQSMFGFVLLGKTVATYSSTEKLSCLSFGAYETMAAVNRSRCDEFFLSDEYAGITLVWESYIVAAASDGNARAMLLNLQKDNVCCGNGLPLHCFDDTRAFPTSHPAPMLLQQRIKCSDKNGIFYLATKDCSKYGRCEYDFPSGTCGQNPVTSSTRGCGSFVFDDLNSQVRAIAVVALAFITFPITFLIFSLCLCFKRRDEDVLPPIEFVSKAKIHANG